MFTERESVWRCRHLEGGQPDTEEADKCLRREEMVLRQDCGALKMPQIPEEALRVDLTPENNEIGDMEQWLGLSEPKTT